MKNISVGFALCGSFCTFEKAINQMAEFVKEGAEVTPIMSQTAYSTDTRFGKAEEIQDKTRELQSKFEGLHS